MLDGEIDVALNLTEALYPDVFKENPDICFRLRCRKFVELMRQSHESPSGAAAEAGRTARNGRSNGFEQPMALDDELAPIVHLDMELDDEDDSAAQSDSDHDMEADDAAGAGGRPQTASDFMKETMAYGTVLGQLYKDDRTKDQALKEIFSLFAYQDPKNSPAAPILDVGGRVPVAEELNSAILGESALPVLRNGRLTASSCLGQVLGRRGGEDLPPDRSAHRSLSHRPRRPRRIRRHRPKRPLLGRAGSASGSVSRTVQRERVRYGGGDRALCSSLLPTCTCNFTPRLLSDTY